MVFYAVIQSIDIIQFGKSHNGRSNRTLINPNFCNPAALIKSCLEMRLMFGYCVTICTVFLKFVLKGFFISIESRKFVHIGISYRV